MCIYIGFSYAIFNMSFKNKAFSEKNSSSCGVSFYQSTLPINNSIKEKGRWTKAEILKRGQDLADIAQKVWRI